ncbi:MAG: heavy metal translocating P-type ATPase [Acidimicrobiales bacterium]
MTSTVDSALAPETAEVSLVVGGMTCGACAARIEQRLNTLPGVVARVNFASERATAVVPPGVPVRRLIEEITDAGYTAQLASTAGGDIGADPEDMDRRVRSLRLRLFVSALLFMPLCDASVAFTVAPNLRFPGWQWLMVALAAPVVTWAAWPFYRAAVRSARHGMSTMDTLVSLGIVSSTVWSLFAMFWYDTSRVPQSAFHLLTHPSTDGIYLDVAAGVTTFVLAGRYFEAWSRRRTGNALHALAAVGAKDVGVLDADGFERRRPVDQLAVGDRFIVRPGETVATDGEVVFGQSAVDRRVMTGESEPLEVGGGDLVVGGTVSTSGRLVVRATRVGGDTQLAQMLRLVERAQNERAAVQRLADRVCNVFVPAVLLIALVTLTAWLMLGYAPDLAFSAALSVLVIACPCALGLATPAALYVATGEGARAGIFFKGYGALESSRQIDTVVLDKTGTVTEGNMTVTDIAAVPGVDPDAVLGWAGALEQASEHPVAAAITTRARADTGPLHQVESFVAMPGLGARGVVDGHHVTVMRFGGRPAGADGADEADRDPSDLAHRCAEWERQGRTVALVHCDGDLVGSIAAADTIRRSAEPAVRQLRSLGLRCVLMTGDNEATARTVADAIGVTEVVAGALPAEKVAAIRQLQGEGRSVAMVGDGVNDGPALVVADLGLAVGSGTDVAINAADLIVVRDDLRAVATAIDLSRRTLRTIHGNLTWACVYNVAAIPLAALGFLNPLLAAGAMALSSGFVVWNSSRLRHVGRPERRPRRPRRESAPTAGRGG